MHKRVVFMIALASKQKKEIEGIISQIQCPKGFRCYKSGFGELCQAKDIGLQSFVECLEEAAQTCPFAVPFASRYLCRCPLRIYVAKKLGK